MTRISYINYIAIIFLFLSCRKERIPPLAEACFSISPQKSIYSVGEVISFDGSCSLNSIVFSWNFGDGNSDSGERSNYFYSKSGTFIVTLSTTNELGELDTISKSIIVEGNNTVECTDSSLIPAFTIGNNRCNLGCEISFNNSTVGADSFLWDFGDGTTSFQENPHHIYLERGIYPVKLVATRNGCADSIMKQAIISCDTLSRSYGTAVIDRGNDIIQTLDGNFVFTGSINGNNQNLDLWLVKLKPDGDTLWSKTFGGEDLHEGISLIENNDGSLVIAGYERKLSSSNRDMYLLKTSSTGNFIWENSYEPLDETLSPNTNDWNQEAVGLVSTSDGGYMLVGSTNSFSIDGSSDVFIVKTSSEGTQEWAKATDGSGDDYGIGIDRTNSNEYLITGFSSNGGFNDMYFLKIKEDGEPVDETSIGGTGVELGNAIAEVSDEGIVIVGETNSSGNRDGFVVKTNPMGNEIWRYESSLEGDDYITSFTETNDNGLLCVGTKINQTSGKNIPYILRLSKNGNLMWEKGFPFASNDTLTSIVGNTSCGYYAIGTTGKSSLNKDAFILKISDNP